MDSYYYGWAPPNPYRGWNSALGTHQNSTPPGDPWGGEIPAPPPPQDPRRVAHGTDPTRTGVVPEPIHASFYDSLDMFEHIFTDFGFSRFLCTPPLLGFSSLFALL